MQHASSVVDQVEHGHGVACQVERVLEVNGHDVLVVERGQPAGFFFARWALALWPGLEAVGFEDCGNRLFADTEFQLAARNHPGDVPGTVAGVVAFDGHDGIDDELWGGWSATRLALGDLHCVALARLGLQPANVGTGREPHEARYPWKMQAQPGNQPSLPPFQRRQFAHQATLGWWRAPPLGGHHFAA